MHDQGITVAIGTCISYRKQKPVVHDKLVDRAGFASQISFLVRARVPGGHVDPFIRPHAGRTLPETERFIFLKIVIVRRANARPDVQCTIRHRCAVLIIALYLSISIARHQQAAYRKGKASFHNQDFKIGREEYCEKICSQLPERV